ncbi:MAG: nicotinamide-nucleotide adenylyltransferase [Thermoprotei archaeon]|nr:MAG: nicotinamide-nucleotide adenylyltransferase [Thermoprotei archaeon]
MRQCSSAARALFVGRFQPFHYGHLSALKWILEREREVVVAVGSAQYSHSFKNPFTLGERLEMIAAALKEEGLWSRVIPVGVPDTDGRHSLWVQLVISYSPRFTRVYTNEPLTRMLFEEAGYEVRGIPFFKRELYEGTRIRRLIAQGGNWERLVPPAVARLIKEVGGVERLRRLWEMDQEKKARGGGARPTPPL